MELSTIRGSPAGKDRSRVVEAVRPNHDRQMNSLDDTSVGNDHARLGGGEPPFRTYKIRWFGLVQLVLLNIIVSWDVGHTSRSSGKS